MPFTCPNCLSQTLAITYALDLPPDSRSDEITVQIVECEQCQFRAAAVYEESRRGRSEAVAHIGYRLTHRIWRSLRDTIRKCPEPRNARCRCPSHRALNWTDRRGRWEGLGVEAEGTFPMVLR